MQTIMDYRMISLEKGKIDETPTYEQAKAYSYSPAEWVRTLHNRQRMIVGTPDVVKQKLTHLAQSFEVNEIVAATFSEEFADRLRSYELLAEMCSLPVSAPQRMEVIA